MASNHPSPPQWTHWPQPQHSQSWTTNMMDYTSHYESPRPVNSGPLVPPIMVPSTMAQYVAGPAYAVSPMRSPEYTPQEHYAYSPYDASAHTPASVVHSHPPTPFRSSASPVQDRSPLPEGPGMVPENPNHQRATAAEVADAPRRGRLRAPKAAHPNNTKDIIYNKPIDIDPVEFKTPVDIMMKALQRTQAKVAGATDSSDMPDSTTVKAESLPTTEYSSDSSSKTASDKSKRFQCKFEGCGQRFSQTTHLQTHRRAHTGEKPYPCAWEGCGRFFSQPGNMKTHMRLHTGIRPYVCDTCGASFPQRGNLAAHMAVHSKVKPFVCRLDRCSKTFTTRGNLKNHQNKYHKETITQYVDWFVSVTDIDELSDHDREMLLYFSNVYKNSNKGIKGRGRNRRVSTARMHKTLSPEAADSPLSTSFDQTTA